MRARGRALAAAGIACALLLVLARAYGPWGAVEDHHDLGPGRSLAPGVVLYQLTSSAAIESPAPLSIWILRVDLARADLRLALAHDQIMDTETVAGIAERHGAVAAVNAGFFQPNGDPLGLLKIGGQIVSDTRRPRGAVGIVRTGERPRLIFDRVAASLSLQVQQPDDEAVTADIAGVDTTRLLGRLMLFTPDYHAHTDTAPGGLEWVVRGDPLRVEGAPRTGGKTPIPPDGYVLSFGGRSPPKELAAALGPGADVTLDTRYMPAESRPDAWELAEDIVGGAGLLARDGAFVDDWAAETFAAGFAEQRHPRTMIGASADGAAWLVVVDGRQPELSTGMTLVELRELARQLGLTDALNLDGGGSTTMWVEGEIVSSPSDAAGPRPVSDALLVVAR
jgi:hypothetical protein